MIMSFDEISFYNRNDYENPQSFFLFKRKQPTSTFENPMSDRQPSQTRHCVIGQRMETDERHVRLVTLPALGD